MVKVASIVRAMCREARRVGQNARARERAAQREALALVLSEMRAACQSAPHGCPVGASRALYLAPAAVRHMRVVAA